MEWDEFWRVIAAAVRPDGLDHRAALADELGRLKWFEVVVFQARLGAAVAAADTPDLRAAAALVQGDPSAGAFRDFRVWLVGRGEATYDAALADPDSLADVLAGDPADGAGLDAVAVRVYESQTGMSDFPQHLALATATLPPPPAADAGPFDEAEARRRFPKLSALYPPPPPAEEDLE